MSKELVAAAFDAWARGEGGVFGLLADDVRWTIVGRTRLAGTYASKAEFVAAATRPIGARLAQPLRPTVQSIVAEGDEVVILWHGHAVANDGVEYRNSYAWFWRFSGEKVVEVTALLDGVAVDELLDRVALA